MIVTAALAWWDERPEDLERCVRGMATVADRVVAVDGAYARYPGATVTSSVEQHDAIRETAIEVGIEPIIVTPDRLWAGQVEKRDHMMRLAAEGSDWIAVVDADYVISGDRPMVRRDLASYTADVVRVIIETPAGNGEYASHYHRLAEQYRTQEFEHIFRALPGMRVERLHWCYSALKDGERVWLFGIPDDTRPKAQSVMLDNYRIRHMTLRRTPEQIRSKRAYFNDREWVRQTTGQEDDQPGLPPPKWDYDALAFEQ